MDGAPDAEKPASVTSVKPSATGMDSHGNATPSASTDKTSGGASQMPLYLSIIALLLGAVAVVISVIKKTK